MLITLLDLQREPVAFDTSIQPGVIDFGIEANQVSPLDVNGKAEILREHRSSKEIIEDIRTQAHWHADFEVPCARCLEAVRHPLGGDFDLLFRPLGADAGPADRALGAPDTEIGYYQGEGLVLEDVLREQVLLSLPARTLCRQDCKGLCPRCGRNLNNEPCVCEDNSSDPRWSALSDLRSRLSPSNE